VLEDPLPINNISTNRTRNKSPSAVLKKCSILVSHGSGLVMVLESSPVCFRNMSNGCVSGGYVKSLNRKNNAMLAAC
jgi:hypothetical protein